MIHLPLLKTIVHDIDDYCLPMFGCFHNCAAVRIDKSYPLQGRRVMHSIWGAGQMAWTKMIIVVDGDADVHDERALIRTMLEKCDFRWDLEVVRGPLDILDQAAPELGAGTKIGFDATRKINGDRLAARSLEDPAIDSETEHEHARDRLSSAGSAFATPAWGARRLTVVGLPQGSPFELVQGTVRTLWERLGPESSAADLVIVVDEDVTLDDFDSILFRLAACADPGRDRFTDQATAGRRICFDATSKNPGMHAGGLRIRPYAPHLKMDPAVVAQITRKWDQLGLPGSP